MSLRNIVGALVGFIFIGLSIGYEANTIVLAVWGKDTVGVVVGSTKDHWSFDSMFSKRSRHYSYAQVRFAPVRGQSTTIIDDDGRITPLPNGTKVTVRYDPANPHRAQVVSSETLYIIPGFMFAFGVVSVGAMFLPRRR